MCEVHPRHVDALNLFLVCWGQLQLSIGGMGGANWRGAQSVNVAQELRWLGIHGKKQVQVQQQYRVIEKEAVRLLNEREAQAAKKT